MTSLSSSLLMLLITYNLWKSSAGISEVEVQTNGPASVINPILLSINPMKPTNKKIQPNATYELRVSNMTRTTRFVLFQVHSLEYEVTLSTESPINRKHGTFDRGVNVGLVRLLQLEQMEASVYLKFTAPHSINVFMRAQLFTHTDPIPGGCNMEFDVEISPFLRVTYDAFVTTLKFQPGSLGYRRGEDQPTCDDSANELGYDFYVYHVTDRDLSEKHYFEAITIMSDLESIKEKARKVGPFFGASRMTFDIVTYRRQGVVFSIVAKDTINGSVFASPYVPAATYGCHVKENSSDPCEELMTPFEWIMAIFAAIFGLFFCFCGHRFFKTALAFYGFLTASLIAYIVLEKFASAQLHYAGVAALTFIFGIMGGIIWLGVWWCFGLPVISILIPGANLGFLIGSVAMFTPLGDLDIFRVSFNYWITVGCIMILVLIPFVTYSKQFHITTCALVGSYGMVMLMDRFVNGCLSYIIINVVRRATVPRYSDAINVTSFESSDALLTGTWVGLTVIGTAFQLWRERKRPPFPNPPSRRPGRRWSQRSALALPESGVSSGDANGLEGEPLLRNGNNQPGYRTTERGPREPSFF